MATTYTGRTRPQSDYTGRNTTTTDWTARTPVVLPVYIDYLLDHLGNRIQDETGDDIIIYANEGFEQITPGTARTQRTQII